MKIIFYEKDGKESAYQSYYCLTHLGEIANWSESEGWSTQYCEGMTFKILYD
jgi:hypothetical protein